MKRTAANKPPTYNVDATTGSPQVIANNEQPTIAGGSAPSGPQHKEELTEKIKRRISDLSPALQPVAVLSAGVLEAALVVFHAVWAMFVPIIAFAAKVAVWSSPALIWVGSKYFKWYINGLMNKAGTALKWVSWLIGLLPKAK